MDPQDGDDRLSRMKTEWSLLFQAHQGERESSAAARQLLMRYYGAVYRYLLGALCDPTAAEDVAQNFAVRFLRGDFRRARPERGRFRDFLKTALRNLVTDYWREKGKAMPSIGSSTEPVSQDQNNDQPFLDSWREELLARAWDALKAIQVETGQPFYLVLRWKAEQPALRSEQLAQQLTKHQGKPVTAVNLRQTLHRAREKFADLLLDEVARSLRTHIKEIVEQELIELGLLDYCKSALKRWEPPVKE